MTPGTVQSAANTEGNIPPGGHLPKPSAGSVTNLICRVKRGEAAAAQELFARYSPRLLGLARVKLQGKDLPVGDEEDVVQSALAGFFRGAERGQYTLLHDRDDLWHLLAKITGRKAQELLKQQRRQKRFPHGAGSGTASQGFAGTLLVDVAVDQIADAKPSPDLEVSANEMIERLLSRLGDARLRAIAVWKWEGYLNEEIAAMLGCSLRTVARKLELIRAIWNDNDAR